MKHTWQTDSKGRPDPFAFEVVGPDMEHGGPRCTTCGFFFCDSCWPKGWDQECPGSPPEGTEYDWLGDGTTREPEQTPEPTPVFRAAQS